MINQKSKGIMLNFMLKYGIIVVCSCIQNNIPCCKGNKRKERKDMIEQKNRKRSFTTVRTFLVVALCLVVGIGMCEASVPKQQQTVHAQMPNEEEGSKKDPLLKMPLSVVESLVAIQEFQQTEVTGTNETPTAIEGAVTPETIEEPSIQGPQTTVKPETESPSKIQGPKQTFGPSSPKETKKKQQKKKKKGITIKVTRDVLMYKESDDSSKVVQKLKAGSVLTVTDSEYGYLKASYTVRKGKKKTGYVHYLYTTYLEKTKVNAVLSVKMTDTRATITGTNVNFRTKPGITSESKVKKTLDQDEIMQIKTYNEVLEDEEKGWYYAEEVSTGINGFVYGEFLDIYVEKEASSSNESKENSEKKTSKEATKKETSKEANKKVSEKESSKKGDKKDSEKQLEAVVLGQDFLMPETETEKAEEDKKEDKKEEKKEKTETKKVKKTEKKTKKSSKSFQGVKLQYSAKYNITSNPLNRRDGVKNYNGHRETYYSQKKRPGGGLKIPGRHVAKDGTVRDKDGYICVSTDWSYKKKHTVLMTSLGPAKVYDTGCSYGTVDVYVNW